MEEGKFKTMRGIKMANFLIAGAGHGGVAAAIHLARAGHSVKIYEKAARDELGYPWKDFLDVEKFCKNGFNKDELDSRHYLQAPKGAFQNPKKSAPKKPNGKYSTDIQINRKYFINHLIDLAQIAGVSFEFETKAALPIIEGTRVTGLVVEKEGCLKNIYADMVIDAAGINSPIRMNLDDALLVEKDLKKGQTFYAWRGIYNKNSTAQEQNDLYMIYLYHMYRPGISWALLQPDEIDILIGSTKALEEDAIRRALIDLREDKPDLGENLLSGGFQTPIPTRRPNAVMVADGYAAIGDCAFMTEPINGSGLDLSLFAGKLLSDTLLKVKDNKYTAKSLWQYQVSYFQAFGADSAASEILKSSMLDLTGEEIDVLFERNIISARQLFTTDRGISSKDAVLLLTKNLGQLPLLLKLVKIMKNCDKIKNLANQIPKTYEYEAVKAWANSYQNFGF